MTAPVQFKVFHDDPIEPRLVASFDELASAKAAMEKTASEVPGTYFVWSSSEEEMMAQVDTRAAWPQSQ